LLRCYDIIIVGSGIVGATTALALAKNPALKIAILEVHPVKTRWEESYIDHRVSAISLASKRIFQNLAIWPIIQAKRVSPYLHMHVWDEGGQGEIHFDCTKINEAVLGYIIEDSVMRTSLTQKIVESATIDFICPVKLKSLQKKSESVELTLDDESVFSAKLVIAADGANSWVREQINSELTTRDYEQTAIVATVQTECSHQQTAWQRFLTTGPLAFLPLRDAHTSSIVWSATHDFANELLSLDDEMFKRRLSSAFAEKLGKIHHVSKCFHFPLRMRHAKNYVEERIALIGDAAHTIHPLAGQGVNLGLLDAVCLAEVVLKDAEKQRDFASVATLRRYERWRKSDNLAMLAAVDFFKQIFLNQTTLVKNARSLGLNFTNQLPILKNMLTQYALGNRGDLPCLAK
jgi:2-octaprenylphenol hydroxylase